MSKNLKTNYKKILFSLLAAACSMNVVIPNYLNATTINTTAGASNVLKMGSSTITFGQIAKDQSGFYVTATLDRQAGIPDNITSISLNVSGKNAPIEINGKNYSVCFSAMFSPIKKVSNTQAQIKLHCSFAGTNGLPTKSITPEMLKGKQVSLPLGELIYYNQATTISKDFSTLLSKVSNVQGISLKQAGFSFLSGESSFKALPLVLPSKNLNIPICDGSHSTIDNIGFVNGKLQIRTKVQMDEFLELKLLDSNGKNLGISSGGVDGEMIFIYNIKDLAALAKCTPKVSGSKVSIFDQGEENLAFTF